MKLNIQAETGYNIGDSVFIPRLNSYGKIIKMEICPSITISSNRNDIINLDETMVSFSIEVDQFTVKHKTQNYDSRGRLCPEWTQKKTTHIVNKKDIEGRKIYKEDIPEESE